MPVAMPELGATASASSTTSSRESTLSPSVSIPTLHLTGTSHSPEPSTLAESVRNRRPRAYRESDQPTGADRKLVVAPLGTVPAAWRFLGGYRRVLLLMGNKWAGNREACNGCHAHCHLHCRLRRRD